MACSISVMNLMACRNGIRDLLIIICISFKNSWVTGWWHPLPHHADLITYASSFTSGETGVAVVNKGIDSKTVEITIKNFRKGDNYYWYTLTGAGDNGEFSRKTLVNGAGPTIASGGPAGYKTLMPLFCEQQAVE